MDTPKGEKLTKSKERVKKYGEVFTPDWMVKKMCDLLQENDTEHKDVFAIPITFLDPTCGNGNFLVETFRRKLQRCHSPADALKALGTIYGIDILHDNVEEARARLYAMYVEAYGPRMEALAILTETIVCGNFLTRLMEDGTPIKFLPPPEEPQPKKRKRGKT